MHVKFCTSLARYFTAQVEAERKKRANILESEGVSVRALKLFFSSRLLGSP